jgi:hypothetical protein
MLLTIKELGAEVFTRVWDVELSLNNSIRSNLAEHLHWVEPCFHTLEPDLVVDFGHGNALDLDDSAVSFRSDLFSFAKPLSAYAPTPGD